MKTHLSLAGWQATLARLAGLLRPRVETVHVVNQRNELQIEGFATCARVGLGGSLGPPGVGGDFKVGVVAQ